MMTLNEAERAALEVLRRRRTATAEEATAAFWAVWNAKGDDWTVPIRLMRLLTVVKWNRSGQSWRVREVFEDLRSFYGERRALDACFANPSQAKGN